MADAEEMESVYKPTELPEGELDDLAKLTNLSADTLLHEVKVRYDADAIYTYVSDILIAVNPFKPLPLYTKEVSAQYNNIIKSDQPPHVYAIADACYHNLFKTKKNQCAVISGESGAGKTVSAKHIIWQIIELSTAGQESHELEDRIVQVSPLLEAFGNAQTVMNDNSSRFGKYTRLLFDEQGLAMGVQISEYLLEKSRVVEQHESERNFHIFYYLFACPDAASKYGLTSPDKYSSLNGSLWPDNETMYQEVLKALRDVGFTKEEEDVLHAVLAAVIHLSNCEFETPEKAELKDASKAAVEKAASLLGIDVAALLESLTVIRTVTRGEEITRPYTVEQAYDCRDATSKALYSRLFGWIVMKVNEKLAPELHSRRVQRPGVASSAQQPSYEIGVLDIFGFENFKDNSFEQMCINVAHEQLQFFFNQHTFRLELAEYDLEGIDGGAAKISFTDNKPLLDMFITRPLGLFALLDEECTLPKATDTSFTNKIDKIFGENPFYKVILKSRGHPAFAVAHFPGNVEYNATHFLEKNRDNLAAPIVEVMQASKVDLVADSFNAEINENGQLEMAEKSQQARVHRGQAVSTTQGNIVHRRAPSLGSQFKNSLSDLVTKMNGALPHFVRCIKPNQAQKPSNFDADFVRAQLSYTGVLEATRIRQEGFSWRPSFDSFVRRFKTIAFPVTMLKRVQENGTAAKKILEKVGIKPYLIGKSKVFLKWYHEEEMEMALKKYYDDVVRVQSAARAFFARKIFKRRLERARMSAKERADAEVREAEEQRRQNEARLARERQQAAERAADAERQAELARLERARAEAEMRAAEEIRLTRMAEVERMELEARKAEAEAHRVSQLAKIEEDRIQAERAIAAAQLAGEEREQALREAEEERRARIQAFEQANEMEEAKKRAEHEADQLRLQRAISVANRKEMLERMNREAETKAKRVEELTAMLEEAKFVAKDAEIRALKAESAVSLEEERAQEKKKAEKSLVEAADVTSPEFSFVTWLQHRTGEDEIACDSIEFSPNILKGRVYKTGVSNKSWKARYFVLNAKAQSLSYFEGEKMKKEKGNIDCSRIIRVFEPKNVTKTQNCFLIELEDRTFFCRCDTPEATRLWVQALDAFIVHATNKAGN